MQAKDQPNQPEAEAASTITNRDAESTPHAPSVTPRSIRVLGTPIISVVVSNHGEGAEESEHDRVTPTTAHNAEPARATNVTASGPAPTMPGAQPGRLVQSAPPKPARASNGGIAEEPLGATRPGPIGYPFFHDMDDDVRPEPPAGIIEGVTLVEPRAVPSNGSELNSVILGPGITAEPVPRQPQSGARSAPTVRTRTRPRRSIPAEPAGGAQRTPTRSSATLLAAIIAVGLVLTGVSALFRSNTASSAAASRSQGPAQPRARANERVDVQAASPQPQSQPISEIGPMVAAAEGVSPASNNVSPASNNVSPTSNNGNPTSNKESGVATRSSPDGARSPETVRIDAAEPVVATRAANPVTNRAAGAIANKAARPRDVGATSTPKSGLAALKPNSSMKRVSTAGEVSSRAAPKASSRESSGVSGSGLASSTVVNEGKSWIKVRD